MATSIVDPGGEKKRRGPVKRKAATDHAAIEKAKAAKFAGHWDPEQYRRQMLDHMQSVWTAMEKGNAINGHPATWRVDSTSVYAIAAALMKLGDAIHKAKIVPFER